MTKCSSNWCIMMYIYVATKHLSMYCRISHQLCFFIKFLCLLEHQLKGADTYSYICYLTLYISNWCTLYKGWTNICWGGGSMGIWCHQPSFQCPMFHFSFLFSLLHRLLIILVWSIHWHVSSFFSFWPRNGFCLPFLIWLVILFFGGGHFHLYFFLKLPIPSPQQIMVHPYLSN